MVSPAEGLRLLSVSLVFCRELDMCGHIVFAFVLLDVCVCAGVCALVCVSASVFLPRPFQSLHLFWPR